MTKRSTSARKRCKHPDCNMWAMALLSQDGYCYDHSPTISPEERRAARAKGGRTSRKVRPLALDDLPETIDDTADLKAYYLGVIRATVEGRITPNQSRALVYAGGALRDTMELELYQQLAARIQKLERLEEPEEASWQVSELSPGE